MKLETSELLQYESLPLRIRRRRISPVGAVVVANAKPSVYIEHTAPGQVRVRRIISRSAPRPVTKYPSVRLDRTIHCESSLEVNVAELLDACAQVTSFGEQPAVIHYNLAGEPRWHVPDFFARTRHHQAFVEVKFAKDITPDVIARTEFLKEALKAEGYEYHLVAEHQIHRGSYLDNARYLLRRGRVRIPRRRGLELFSQIKTAGALPFGAFAVDADRNLVVRMILDGLLSVPMDAALGPHSPVTIAEKGEGQPWVWALFS